MKQLKQQGFTLFELLVVIAIIGLLSSMTTYFVNNARIRARDARRLSDMRQIQSALEMYYDDNLYYPQIKQARTGDEVDGCGPDDGEPQGKWCTLFTALSDYIAKPIQDPKGLQTDFRYYYDADSGDSYQSYGLMCRLEHPANFSLADNDGGFYNLGNGENYEVGSQPPYCMNMGMGQNWWSVDCWTCINPPAPDGTPCAGGSGMCVSGVCVFF